jgi:hypothetical protein
MPSGFAMEMIKKVAGSGIDVSVIPQFIGGFMRLKSGQTSASLKP